jgi:hypothetical protein
MVDFKTFKKREIKSPKISVKFEFELIDSSLTADEAAERIQQLINGYKLPQFSDLVVALLRETRSSMWELKNLEIT